MAREISDSDRAVVRTMEALFPKETGEAAQWRGVVERPDAPPRDVKRVREVDASLPKDLVAAVEISNTDDLNELQDVLWALEMIDINDDDLRKRLAIALLDLAIKLRDDSRGAATPALWSAVRRYAALVDESEQKHSWSS